MQFAAGPHEIETSAKVQAPLASSQSVAPQGVTMLLQPAVQQWPVPMTPQKPEVQASFSSQAPTAILATQTAELQ